ncbi:hypothetical protein Tco_1339788 [Tanacetum coccineum]
MSGGGDGMRGFKHTLAKYKVLLFMSWNPLGNCGGRLVPASKEVCSDPNTPVLIHYEINGKMYQLTNEQIHAHIEKEEQIQKVAQEAKLFELSNPELIKVVEEVASKAGVDPNALRSKKGG